MNLFSIKAFRSLFVCAACLLALQFPLSCKAEGRSHALADNIPSQETTVYVTNTGTKYHKSTCRYLSQSKIKTPLKKALAT